MNIETDIRELYERITKLLIEKKLTITTMESATAGQIASLITDTEGASDVMKGAFITYSNEAKIRQGVPSEIIIQYGVYSEETAKAMAIACRKAYDADIGLGITGTFGNIDPKNNDSVPCEIYFAIDINGEVTSYKRVLQPQHSRYYYKLAVAKEIAGKLLSKYMNNTDVK